MNRQEAYSHLGVDEGSSQDELKTKFRKLAKQLHPDNKETGNEAKFKQINEAYNRITNNDFPEERQGFHVNPFDGFDDMFSTFFGGNGNFAAHGFSPFGRNAPASMPIIEVSINIPRSVFPPSMIVPSEPMRVIGKFWSVFHAKAAPEAS